MQMKTCSRSQNNRVALALLSILLLTASACSRSKVRASAPGTPEGSALTVGVTTVTVKPISRQLTVSSELVPFQEIDVYAKESGYVRDINVDYGSRVKKGDVMAILEIPELEQLIAQDSAAIQKATDQVTHAQKEVNLFKAQYNVAHLQYTRLKSVAESHAGLVAQQEVDNNEGKDLASEAQVEAGESALLAAQSQLEQAKAKKEQDQALFAYTRLTAPFDGVVTQRFANQGTLMQAGTNSSTQAMPLVRLSEDDVFRLVIPVAESYVRYIKIGDTVQVRVPSLDKSFPGKVKRFSSDVAAETRTMHTEVEVLNPSHVLLPGLYADATITLERKNRALVVPMQALSQTGDTATVFVVDMNNRLQSRKVSIGLQAANDAEVLTGLNEGDRVVVSDRSGLKAGVEVQPQTIDVPQYQSGDSNQ
jgi:RND family efflux transporter MFP subunit